MPENIIERQELYDLVWSRPIKQIAPDYGISDSALIKICQKLRVPRPARGHWARIAAGQKPNMTKLPEVPDDFARIHQIATWHTKPKDALAEDDPHPLIQRESDPKFFITVGDNTETLIKLAAKNYKFFLNAKKLDRGILHPRAKLHFNLRVTEAGRDRAIVVMNALLRAFEQRGWKFKIKRDPQLIMGVTVLEEEIQFSIDERTKGIPHILTEEEKRKKRRSEHYWTPKYDGYEPTGLLRLKIENAPHAVRSKSWNDGKKLKIEQRLNQFCIAVIHTALTIKIRRAEEEERRKQAQIEALRRAELRKLRDVELKARDSLHEIHDKWAGAESIRAFVSALETSCGEEITWQGENMPTSDWLPWARNYADLLDPLTQGSPSVVEETAGLFWEHSYAGESKWR